MGVVISQSAKVPSTNAASAALTCSTEALQLPLFDSLMKPRIDRVIVPFVPRVNSSVIALSALRVASPVVSAGALRPARFAVIAMRDITCGAVPVHTPSKELSSSS